MKLKIYCIIFLIIAVAITGCYEAPLDNEQYFKQVYLVGASSIADGPFQQEVKYSDMESETYVSVATGGSLNVDQNVNVTLGLYPSAIDWYNNKYLSDNDIRYQLLDESAYTIASMTATIRAGETYTRVPIHINTRTLHCDSLYVIPLKIVNADLPINESDSALLLTIKMMNDYSGDYQMDGSKLQTGLEKPTSLVGRRALVAVNQYTVRYYHENTPEEVENAADYGVNFTVNPADNTVLVSGYDRFLVKDGGGLWEPATKTFTVWYIFDKDGKEYRDDLTFEQE